MLSSLKNTINKNPLAKQTPSSRGKDDELHPLAGGPGDGPPPLDRHLALIVGIAARVAVLSPSDASEEAEESTVGLREREAWLEAVCGNLHLDSSLLPESPTESDFVPMLPDLQRVDYELIAHSLLLSSIFPPPSDSDSTIPKSAPASASKAIAYTSTSRANVFRTLRLLGVDPAEVVVREEEKVAAELYDLLKKSTEGEGAGPAGRDKENEEVEKARKAKEDGWGGKWGRWAATGAGVVIGSVAIGLTGGLAAPAILALLPASLAILTPATAPILLGTFFGLTGGGLAGRRVSRRWAGVGEFEFIEVGREKEKEVAVDVAVPYEVRKKKTDVPSVEETGIGRLSLDAAAEDKKDEETVALPPRPPSLTVIVALPGLLLDDQDEGVRAWEHAAKSLRAGPAGVVPEVVLTEEDEKTEKSEAEEFEVEEIKENNVDELTGDEGALLLRGRDLFVAKVETVKMLQTGKNIHDWITSKLIGKAGKEIIKRTFVNVYFAAVALPLTVYGWAGTALDNTWMQSVDKARKAGPILASVLLSRVQGSRPVVLVGTSLGALTIFHALLELAKSAKPEEVAGLVDSAILVGMPSTPSGEQWEKVRGVVGRRVVNGFSRKDFVLASVVRLHEVVGGMAEARVDGGRVAGLGPVAQKGVEDVDLSGVVDGHFEINKKLPEILRLIDLDA